MDIRKIKKLIELLESSEVAELEVHEGEEWVRISRQGQLSAAPALSAAPEPDAAPGQGPAEPEPGHVVRAPMVGTFYASPKPKDRPYVELGQQIGQGDVLCIIEAMKVLNHIEAPVSGTVQKVMAENGDPVEYGQPLFAIQVGE